MIGKRKNADAPVKAASSQASRSKRRNSKKSDNSAKETTVTSQTSSSHISSDVTIQAQQPESASAFDNVDYTGANNNANMQSTDYFEKYAGGDISLNDLQRINDIISRIEHIFRQRVVGQTQLWYTLMVSLIANGHILIESVPGLAKTTAAQTLCNAVSGKFSRIQCTPDLMPSDIVGTQIYNYGTGQFTTQLGPVHANFVLLDEINRSSAKTQSAMLEAMQERQTTIGEETHRLPNPFMVIATQNPIEEEGTYVLPEAQMDRFLLKEIITYPTPDEEVSILGKMTSGAFETPLDGYLTSLDDVKFMQNTLNQVYVSPAIVHYVISLVNTTRGGGPNPIVGLNNLIRVPASPRASISFVKAAQALALMRNRSFVLPEDVKDLRYSVLRHRIIRTFDAMAEDVAVETIVDQIFQVVPVP